MNQTPYLVGFSLACDQDASFEDDFEELADLAEDTPITEEDEEYEEFHEGLIDGLMCAAHFNGRETDSEEAADLTDPAARYSGGLVFYVWNEGADWRTVVCEVDSNEPLMALTFEASDRVMSKSDLDEDEYTISARHALDVLMEKHEDIATLADIDENGQIWMSVDYDARWEEEGDDDSDDGVTGDSDDNSDLE